MARRIGREAMRRLISVAAALVLSLAIAACTGMGEQGMSDKTKSERSTSNGGSHY